MTRVVITGPTGAIGVALIQECIRRGMEVYAICRKDSPRMQNIPNHERVHRIECNLDCLGEMDVSHISDCDMFFHFGWMGTTGEARNDTVLQTKNIRYTLDAVALAQKLGCHTFIGAGSQAEYGRVEGKLDDATPTFPENGYGIAKLCAGQLSRIECEKRGIKHVWTRILSVYGPYDGAGSMVMSTLNKLLRGETPELTAGEQKWDYLYSGDAAKALLAAGEKGKDGKVYCIGSGQARPLKDYIHVMANQINPDLPLGFGKIPYGPRQVMYLCADISMLTRDTGFVPETDFETGIAETIDWLQKEKCNENH